MNITKYITLVILAFSFSVRVDAAKTISFSDAAIAAMNSPTELAGDYSVDYNITTSDGTTNTQWPRDLATGKLSIVTLPDNAKSITVNVNAGPKTPKAGTIDIIGISSSYTIAYTGSTGAKMLVITPATSAAAAFAGKTITITLSPFTLKLLDPTDKVYVGITNKPSINDTPWQNPSTPFSLTTKSPIMSVLITTATGVRRFSIARNINEARVPNTTKPATSFVINATATIHVDPVSTAASTSSQQ